MPRNRDESPGELRAVPTDLASRLSVNTHRYHKPDGDTGWVLPDASTIVNDFAKCGGNLNTFLGMLGNKSDEEKEAFLGAIMRKVRGTLRDYEEFKAVREAGEEASLLMVHEQLYKLARAGDVPAMKFLLERRMKGYFGRDAKGIDDTEEWIKQELERLSDS